MTIEPIREGACKDEIVRKINALSGSHSPYEIFRDWIEWSALGIQNSLCLFHDDTWKFREQRYMDIVKKYPRKDIDVFVEMFALLTMELEEEISDVLGWIYMHAEMGSKQTGQFFTPFHLSLLTAEMGIPQDISEENPLIMSEPSCGGGGMIIATARVLKERGLNYQRCMKVFAQDLDWKGVYMTYVQLSLLGIRAVVVQGDSLAGAEYYPEERRLRTPAEKGVVL